MNVIAIKVFLSYSSANTEITDEICEYLEKRGKSCWMAPRDIPAGTEYGEEIIKGIEGCDIMLVVFSRTANASQHVLREVERGVSKNMPIIVFQLEECPLSKSMEYFLLTTQWLNASKDTEGMLEPLNAGIEKLYELKSRSEEEAGVMPPASTIRVSSRTVTVLLAVIALGIVALAVSLIVGAVSDVKSEDESISVTESAKTVSIVATSEEVRETPEVTETSAAEDFTVPSEEMSAETSPPEDFFAYDGSHEHTVPVSFSSDEKVYADLNGDGTDEEILFSLGDDAAASSYLYVNGTEYECRSYSLNCFWLCDIDSADGFIELAVSEYGASNDFETYFYRFDGDVLYDIGAVANLIDDTVERGYGVELGIPTIFYGDGTISTARRLDIFQTWSAETIYTYSDEAGCICEYSSMYYPYYEGNSESFLDVYAMFSSLSGDSEPPPFPEVTETLYLYEQSDVLSAPVEFAPQRFAATATDNSCWVYLVGENGAKGWLYLPNGDEYARNAETGEDYLYVDKMINLYISD